MDGQTQARLKQLPKVDALLSDGACQSLIDLHGRPLVVDAIRDILAEIRMELRDNHAATLPDAHTIIQRAEDHLNRHARTSLRRVVNATGIVLHTNLGRAPLADEALQAIREVGEGYSNLEYDTTAGARGSWLASGTSGRIS